MRTNESEMLGINGYKIERIKLLEADKSRGSYFKPFINPESYTDEEKEFM